MEFINELDVLKREYYERSLLLLSTDNEYFKSSFLQPLFRKAEELGVHVKTTTVDDELELFKILTKSQMEIGFLSINVDIVLKNIMTMDILSKRFEEIYNVSSITMIIEQIEMIQKR